jgi:hypothetical protein
MFRKCESEVLKGKPGIIELALFCLAQAEIKPRLNPLLCIGIGRNELAELFEGKVVKLVIVEIDRQLEIRILLGVLSDGDGEPRDEKDQQKEGSMLHTPKR